MTRLPKTAAQRAATVRQMTPGAAGGRTPLIAPTTSHRPASSVASRRIEAWSWSSDGDVIVSAVSDVYEVLVGGRSLDVIANLTAALTGDTDVDILVNGSLVDTVTIASGTTREAVTLAMALDPGDLVALESTAVGTGSARCTVQMKVES